VTNVATKRKRGGQPGNTNALKHGIYRKHYTTDEITDLETALQSGLQDEIALLRVLLKRTFALASGVEDLEESTKTLNALGAATTRLSGLLRVDKLLGGGGGNAAEAIATAISEVATELGLLHN